MALKHADVALLSTMILEQNLSKIEFTEVGQIYYNS